MPPARVNWVEEGIITPVKDQHVNGSKCGCCYAFGGIAGVEAANAKFTGQVGGAGVGWSFALQAAPTLTVLCVLAGWGLCACGQHVRRSPSLS